MDFSKPNGVYLYRDPKDERTDRQLRRRIMLNDTWEEDYKEYIKDNPSHSPTEIARNLGIPRTTVYKYL